jgi:hypothetical protein
VTKRKMPARRRHSRYRVSPYLIAAAIAAVVLIGVGFIIRGGKGASTAKAGIVKTGQMNGMGMPVIETTGSASGSAAAGGVQVTGANWALGTVPLKVAVRPTWTLSNTSSEAVTLGEPTAEVKKGCCPGPLTLASRTLAPGESTTLTFELSMHPGMDGWHDIAVHVPVSASMGEVMLSLGVTGDFHD